MMFRYITPPGTGFLPRETALHHQQHVVALVQQALDEAKLGPRDISSIAYTKVETPELCTGSVVLRFVSRELSFFKLRCCSAGARDGRSTALLRRMRTHAFPHVESSHGGRQPLYRYARFTRSHVRVPGICCSPLITSTNCRAHRDGPGSVWS